MPRPRTVSGDDVVRLMRAAFRSNGYDGTSLEALAAATGLTKAALYHHFPRGKVGMAGAVLDDLRVWSAVHIIEPLAAEGDPRQRLDAMVAALHELYAGGHEACLVGLFSNGEPLTHFQPQLKRSLTELMSAIADVLVEAGLPAGVAQARAEDTVVRIQGSLVVSRVLGDTGPFSRLLANLTDSLLRAPGEVEPATPSQQVQ